MRRVPRLHVVTNDEVLAHPGFAETSRRLIGPGGAGIALHVRGHRTPAATLYDIACVLQAACVPPSVIFVNDRVDIALCAGVDGIQLGSRSLPLAGVHAWIDARSRDAGRVPMIGYSAHDPEGAKRAADDGADLVLAGTIWASGTHPQAPPAGTGLIEATAHSVRVPVIAIGGVRPGRVAEARRAGAWGVAVIGFVWKGEWPGAPERACGELLAALDAADSNTDMD